MASLATTDKCPYCLQVTNQGQSQYGPICNNGHRAHLNCIMNQFESNGRFNIDTWTCPLCRAPAYYSPDSGIPSLNKVLRERFPRRIAELEAVPLVAPVDYISEGESQEEPDDSQGAFDAYAEELPPNETPETVNRINQLITHFPFLGAEYRENEQEYVDSIMNGLSAEVRMLGVFWESAQFQDTVDAANMGDILLTQWYNMYNMATAYEDEGDMEELHSSLSNQSPFFRALTMAILSGFMRQFWNLDQEHLDILNEVRRRAAQADGVLTGGKRKKKKTRRKRKGKKRKTRKKRGGAVTEFIVKNDQANINAFFNEIRRRQIDGSYVEHLPSDELGLEHLEEMMMESLLTGEYVEGIYGVTYAPNRNEGPYGRFFADYFDDMDSLTERLEIVSENNRFPSDVTQLQSAVEEQIILPHPGRESPNTIMDVDDLSGGRKRRRKRKTRKKRGAVKFGKNKTTAEIVKEGRKILQTTPQKKKRQIREQQIKLTGEQEFALFKKQALNQMKIAFIKSFGEPPSNMDKKILTLVYKFLKDEISKEETDFIEDYRAKNNENKRKLVWMNNSLRQLRDESVKRKHQIYNTGDDPEVIKKYRPRQRPRKDGPATGLVVDTNKYMSPVKGPDTRYPKLSLDIGERSKSHKNLFQEGGRKKKRRTRKKNRR